MLTIEKKEEFIIIKNDGVAILECFQKIKRDTNFDGYYLGVSADKEGGVVLFSTNGEFIYKFPKTDANASISTLLDEMVGSVNIIQSMKRVQSLNFWTDKDVVRALRCKHHDLNQKRLASCKNDVRVDVLYDIEKASIEKFLRGRQAVKIAREGMSKLSSAGKDSSDKKKN